MNRKLPADFEYLPDMYKDEYFPDFLVDELREIIRNAVIFIEEGNHSDKEIQESFDRMVLKINHLQDEFEENDSEIETVARESIGETVDRILQYFEITTGVEEAIRNRDW